MSPRNYIYILLICCEGNVNAAWIMAIGDIFWSEGRAIFLFCMEVVGKWSWVDGGRTKQDFDIGDQGSHHRVLRVIRFRQHKHSMVRLGKDRLFG